MTTWQVMRHRVMRTPPPVLPTWCPGPFGTPPDLTNMQGMHRDMTRSARSDPIASDPARRMPSITGGRYGHAAWRLAHNLAIQPGEPGHWMWGAGVNSEGYPVVTIDRRMQYVARVLYAAEHGEVIGPLRSTCGERRCVAPVHRTPMRPQPPRPIDPPPTKAPRPVMRSVMSPSLDPQTWMPRTWPPPPPKPKPVPPAAELPRANEWRPSPKKEDKP